jgi:hypothetical protein
MRAKYRELRGPQGVALAQARRRKEQLQGAVQALQAANRILARRQDGTRATEVEGAPQDLEEAAVSAENLATAMERVNENISEFNEQTDQAAEKTEDAGDEVDSNINNQIARGIQLSAQLGATLVQSARQGGLSFQQAFSSVLQTVSSVLALSGNPILGAALGGVGSFVGAFQEGGRVPHAGMALVGERGPELVNLPGGSRVRSNSETERMINAGMSQNVVVRVEQELVRLPNGDLGAAVNESQKRASIYDRRNG